MSAYPASRARLPEPLEITRLTQASNLGAVRSSRTGRTKPSENNQAKDFTERPSPVRPETGSGRPAGPTVKILRECNRNSVSQRITRDLSATLQQLLDQLAPSESRGTAADVFDAWSRARWRDLKPRTVEEYDRATRHFLACFGAVSTAALTRDDIELAMDQAAAGSRSSYFSVVSSCLRWADRNGWPGLARLVPERRPTSRPRNFHFSDTLWRTFWRALRAARPEKGRGWATQQTVDAIAFDALSALRLGELVSLQWTEVSIQHRAIWLHDTKAGDRVVAIPPTAAAILDRQPRRGRYVWMKANGRRLGDKAVSSAYRKICQRYGHGLESSENCFHTLRHSWASLALREGVPMEMVRRQLGHSTTHMTNRYAHLGDEALRRQVDRLEGAIVGDEAIQLALGVES